MKRGQIPNQNAAYWIAVAVYTDPWDPDDTSAAAARCQSCAAGRYCTASTGIEAARRRTAAASRARVRAAFFLRNPSQQPAAADLGKGQYPDAGWNPFGELGASGKRGKAGGVEPCARRRGQGAYNVIWQLGVSHYIKEKEK